MGVFEKWVEGKYNLVENEEQQGRRNVLSGVQRDVSPQDLINQHMQNLRQQRPQQQQQQQQQDQMPQQQGRPQAPQQGQEEEDTTDYFQELTFIKGVWPSFENALNIAINKAGKENVTPARAVAILAGIISYFESKYGVNEDHVKRALAMDTGD